MSKILLETFNGSPIFITVFKRDRHLSVPRARRIPSTLYLNSFNIMAYRPVAGQRPLNKQRVQPLLCSRRMNKRPFLSNDSVNAFPRKRDAHNNTVGSGGFFWVVRAEELKRRQLGQSSSVVTWKSACEEKTSRLMWNGRQPGTPSVEFSWGLAVESRSARGGWEKMAL
jgi:hypothetical protein